MTAMRAGRKEVQNVPRNRIEHKNAGSSLREERQHLRLDNPAGCLPPASLTPLFSTQTLTLSGTQLIKLFRNPAERKGVVSYNSRIILFGQ